MFDAPVQDVLHLRMARISEQRAMPERARPEFAAAVEERDDLSFTERLRDGARVVGLAAGLGDGVGPAGIHVIARRVADARRAEHVMREIQRRAIAVPSSPQPGNRWTRANGLSRLTRMFAFELRNEPPDRHRLSPL